MQAREIGSLRRQSDSRDVRHLAYASTGGAGDWSRTTRPIRDEAEGADLASVRSVFSDLSQPADRHRDLVLVRSRLARPPLVPELQLHLAEDMDAAWTGLQVELDDGKLPPPFWAFAWLGGQALARYVLDAPAEVAGLRVLDLATGSGLVALAARLAGAAQVTAVDVDPLAVTAVALNATANDLTVDPSLGDLLGESPPDVDVVLAGDVFYDVDLAERIRPWLLAARAAGARVLVGDPGRHYLPQDLVTQVAAYDVPTTRDLEGVEIKNVRVYAFGGQPQQPQPGHGAYGRAAPWEHGA